MKFANNIRLSQFLDKFLDAQAKSDESASAEYNAILMLPDVDLMQVRIVASVFDMCLRRIVFFSFL